MQDHLQIDIKYSYPKSEETFSLGGKEHGEAVKKVRIEAAREDTKFDDHRCKLALDITRLIITALDAVMYIGPVKACGWCHAA